VTEEKKGPGIKLYECPTCFEPMVSEDLLKKHIERVHRDKQ
jgi:hypothetical protein